MSTSRAIGAVAGYAAMALAIAVGVAGFMVADVSRGGWCSCGGSGRGEPTFDAIGSPPHRAIEALSQYQFVAHKKARLRPSPSTGL